MDRPYIICHMVTSIDGKVTGDFLNREQSEKAIETYYEINRELRCNGFICGRVTMEGSFTGGWYPELSDYEEKPRTDYIPKELSGFYAVAFDTCGKLGWKSSKIEDEDPGYDKAQIVEVLSEQVDGRYLGYLQKMGIPYIFAGENEINVGQALTKLKNLMNIEMLLLEGGSIINGSFLKADAVDELSLVVSPAIAEKDDKMLFMDSKLADFQLLKAENREDVLTLRYKKQTMEEI